jgi:serine/threonine protein kinase
LHRPKFKQEEEKENIKLYQEEDMFSKRSPLNFPIVPYDRYFQDFEELSLLGEGGCGKVFKVRNRVDNNIYCIKMVKLSKKNKQANKFIKREVDI